MLDLHPTLKIQLYLFNKKKVFMSHKEGCDLCYICLHLTLKTIPNPLIKKGFMFQKERFFVVHARFGFHCMITLHPTATNI